MSIVWNSKYVSVCFYFSYQVILIYLLLHFTVFRIIRMPTAEPIIRSRQTEKEINGIPTQVVCTEFSNYIFIVITQYGKLGTLISVTPDSRSNDVSTPMFSTKVLLGKDEVGWRKWFRKISYLWYRIFFTGHQVGFQAIAWSAAVDWTKLNVFN